MGVIKKWKGHYRSHLSSRVIAALDADPSKRALDVVKSVSLLDTLYFTKEACDLVSLRNCFHKGGFFEPEPICNDTFEDVTVPDNMTPEEFEEFVNVDRDVEIAELTDAELLEAV